MSSSCMCVSVFVWFSLLRTLWFLFLKRRRGCVPGSHVDARIGKLINFIIASVCVQV